MNLDFTPAADTVRGTNRQLEQLAGTAPVRPAPGPAVPFPLPDGYYFGPRSDGDSSVSGYYRRRFRGKSDRQWLAMWTEQLSRRGGPAARKSGICVRAATTAGTAQSAES